MFHSQIGSRIVAGPVGEIDISIVPVGKGFFEKFLSNMLDPGFIDIFLIFA
jgi:hypothetical protein